ncbi:von Willebrand factor A domain-containing protein 5A-like, partial [Python bivittatus]|uniref:von Willebrand factor A domain-containing protein 5A-like n=1 Tax=Python bivittatus TaxID=176946 RepID=A0A9F2RE44_PYTBI
PLHRIPVFLQALQSLKKALQPAVTGISLSWELPPGLEATLVGSGPQVIFQGQRCLVYAQIHGQLQTSGSTEGTAVVRYNFQNETPTETIKISLRLEKTDRLPVHRLAAQAVLQELEEAKEKVEEKRHLALEISLNSGVVCSQTAYVGVNTELGKPVQGPLLHRDVPLSLPVFSRRSRSVGCAMLPPPLPSIVGCSFIGSAKFQGASLYANLEGNSCQSLGKVNKRNAVLINFLYILYEGQRWDALQVVPSLRTGSIPKVCP